MATYAAFKHVELHKIGHGKNRVPNAPRSRISEIFNGDEADGRIANGARNGNGRVRSPRETPTRPRDTHNRLFGQNEHSHQAPLITDNVRSNIRFGDGETNGTASSSPAKSPLLNGSGPNTPSRGSTLMVPPRRNPVTGDGINLPQYCRRWAAARDRGYSAPPLTTDLTEPPPLHSYTDPVNWPPTKPPYLVYSASKPQPNFSINPYTLIDLHAPPTLHKYEAYDLGPIPDYTLLQTPVIPGPHTLACYPPVLTHHVPGYLFNQRIDRTQYY